VGWGEGIQLGVRQWILLPIVSVDVDLWDIRNEIMLSLVVHDLHGVTIFLNRSLKRFKSNRQDFYGTVEYKILDSIS